NGEMLSKGPRPYLNKAREIPWQSILKNWRQKPRSIVYSRYFPYLPGRISYYLNIESMKLRKERVEWLLSLIINHDMQEIDGKFYELLPEETTVNDCCYGASTNHPYDVDWDMYDSLRPTDQSVLNEGVQHE